MKQDMNTISESGRSMTEMLGVLAVIGVLSIGGIQGYTYTMNKYRSNNILNEVNIASQDLSLKLLTAHTGNKQLRLGNPYDLGEITHEKFPFAYGCGNYGNESKNCHIDETGYWTTIRNVPEEVCKNMLSKSEKLPNLVQKKLNGVVVEDGSDCGENNEITLLFNAEGTGELAKNCGEGAGVEPEEPEVPTISCPTNTSTEGEGGLAKTLTDETTGKAVQCYCVERDTSYNEETGECETLPEKCSSNAQCNRGEYCDITDHKRCTKDTNSMSGICRNAQADLRDKLETAPFWVSRRTMKWWSAVHFCQALGKSLVKVSDYGCAKTFCQSGCNATNGMCYIDTSSSNITVNVATMKAAYGLAIEADQGHMWTWTNTDFDACAAYHFNLVNGFVYWLDRATLRPAVCK